MTPQQLPQTLAAALKHLRDAVMGLLRRARARFGELFVSPAERRQLRSSGLFDDAWYLARNRDVAATKMDPLIHFLRYGAREGRRPNPVFDGVWYLQKYPDVAASGVNPLVHYARHGAREGRASSPEFDPRWYLANHPDIGAANLEPLSHYLVFGRAEGRATAPPGISENPSFLNIVHEHRLSSNRGLEGLLPSRTAERSGVVDVVVPVYAGLAATVACIESVLRSRSSNASFGRLVLVNDASPEPELRAYLQQIAQTGDAVLIENPENLGFILSVNKGMTFADPHDVILLNSDTKVSGDWLDRLNAQAYSASDIGTVTPFSNNGTICSIPDVGEHARLPEGLSLEIVDAAAARVNHGRNVTIPTAVGFCMYINRACLREVGEFDFETWGKGYGEETDFSQKAIRLGWRNVLAGDVVVYHEGGVSFGSSANARRTKAQAKMRTLHPDYERSVDNWLARDPALPMRLALLVALQSKQELPVLMHITHPWGGGTERHISQLTTALSDRARHLVLTLRRSAEGYHIELLLPDGAAWRRVHFAISDLMSLTPLFEVLGVARVHVHHAAEAMDQLSALLAAVGVKYDLSVHDYALVCPRTNLARDGAYCGEPDTLGCLECLSAKPEPRALDIIWWRERGRVLIDGADRVIGPSADAADRVQRYAPKARIIAAPHETSLYRPRGKEIQAPTLGADESLRVAIFGVLSENKGGAFLLSCVEAAKASGALISWTVIGEFAPPLDLRAKKLSNALDVTGPYKNADVSRLISNADPHLIFFPQHIPETYSYTLSEAFNAARPILAPRLGSFPERLADRHGAWLYSIDSSADEIVRLILKIRDGMARGEFPSDLGVSAPVLRAKVAESFFDDRYLADLL